VYGFYPEDEGGGFSEITVLDVIQEATFQTCIGVKI
jgi:hypothetical protein